MWVEIMNGISSLVRGQLALSLSLPCEDKMTRQSFVSQKEGLHQNLNIPAT